MPKEIEAKYLSIQKDKVRELLMLNNYTLKKPETLMKRKTFHFPESQKNEWVRVRDEGNKITMTYKYVSDSNSIHGTNEVEIVVNDFENACSFLNVCKIQESSYQENYREKWVKNDIEVCIDTWPGIDPYIEIEAPEEEQVILASSELGFDYSTALFGGTDVVYKKILNIPPEKMIRIKTITFDNPPRC